MSPASEPAWPKRRLTYAVFASAAIALPRLVYMLGGNGRLPSLVLSTRSTNIEGGMLF
jgi:hypothetical protein